MSNKEKFYMQREISIMKSMNSLYVIKILNYYIEPEYMLNIVMPCAKNGSLRDIINKRTTLSEEMVLNYVSQIAFGIESLHSSHITHRDLKPENILNFDGLLKICDFGVSVESTKSIRSNVGSPCYMAPELCIQNVYDKKVDIWSLGCIVYELCMMETLCSDYFAYVYPDKSKFMPSISISKSYSPNMAKLVTNLLSVDPDKRPDIKTVREYLNEF